MTPLFSWSAKEAAQAKCLGDFTQYALLGHVITTPFDEEIDESNLTPINDSESGFIGKSLTEDEAEDIDPVMLNTDTPWSAFICGSQGSGKSHTMSCVLENCLLEDKRIGMLSEPLSGLVFHYDSMNSSHAEVAHLCSQGIPVHVLISPSNFENLKKKYGSIPEAEGNITVEELYLQDAHFNTEHIKRLMAFGDDNEHPPLYLQVNDLVPLRIDFADIFCRLC